jgi:hypothetical protein
MNTEGMIDWLYNKKVTISEIKKKVRLTSRAKRTILANGTVCHACA